VSGVFAIGVGVGVLLCHGSSVEWRFREPKPYGRVGCGSAYFGYRLSAVGFSNPIDFFNVANGSVVCSCFLILLLGAKHSISTRSRQDCSAIFTTIELPPF